MQVFSGSLEAVANNSQSAERPNGFDIVIKLTTPFLYDPSKGNLLLDIRNTQGGIQTPPLDQEIDAASVKCDSVSRVYNYGDSAASSAGSIGSRREKDTVRLVPQFGTTTNPAALPSSTPTATVSVIEVDESN